MDLSSVSTNQPNLIELLLQDNILGSFVDFKGLPDTITVSLGICFGDVCVCESVCFVSLWARGLKLKKMADVDVHCNPSIYCNGCADTEDRTLDVCQGRIDCANTCVCSETCTTTTTTTQPSLNSLFHVFFIFFFFLPNDISNQNNKQINKQKLHTNNDCFCRPRQSHALWLNYDSTLCATYDTQNICENNLCVWKCT